MINNIRREQHYAVSKSGKVLHIEEAHANGEDCFCLYCGCKLIKKCGKLRAWHFAHDTHYGNDVAKNCSYESYLHSLAKKRIKKWFDESESIILYYKQPFVCEFQHDCKWKYSENECIEYREESVNLKDCLKECRVEETVYINGNTFRPDLYWINPQKPENNIFIEINVTHECTEQKIDSQARIIEFDIQSEEDIDNIINNEIRESDKVRFYNFNPSYKNDEEMPAKYRLLKFFYYKSGKAYAGFDCNCKTYKDRRESSLLEVTIEYFPYLYIDFPFKIIMNEDGTISASSSRLYNWGMAIAKNNGYDVRTCYMCKNCAYNNTEKLLRCSLKSNQGCKAIYAVECENFCENPEIYKKNMQDFIDFKQDTVVDIWKKS